MPVAKAVGENRMQPDSAEFRNLQASAGERNSTCSAKDRQQSRARWAKLRAGRQSTGPFRNLHPEQVRHLAVLTGIRLSCPSSLAGRRGGGKQRSSIPGNRIGRSQSLQPRIHANFHGSKKRETLRY